MPAPTEAAETGGELDEDKLSLVHSTLSKCLRDDDVGLLVRYRKGKAATDSQKQAKFERTLASPVEIKKALDAGALYIGVRDDARSKGKSPDGTSSSSRPRMRLRRPRASCLSSRASPPRSRGAT